MLLLSTNKQRCVFMSPNYGIIQKILEKIYLMSHNRLLLIFSLFYFSCFILIPASFNRVEAAEKNDYATVIMYHRFGESRFPSTNVTVEQFESHLEFISQGNYEVVPLIEIIETLQSGAEIQDKTVAITIDDAYLSVYKKAWPRLKEYGFPFTIFVATDPVDNNLRNYMNWDQIRELQDTGVTIGSQTKSHPHMHRLSPIKVEQEITLSNNRFLEETGQYPKLFAYPYGEYSLDVVKAVKDAGFIAAFGQNSGVLFAEDNMFELPRFAFNENYGSIDRLQLALDGKPLRVKDITPQDMVLSENPPLYGFTVEDSLTPIKQLRCFSGEYGKLNVEILGPRAEIRLPGVMRGPRSRINCTMPAEDGRWRWYGRQFLTE